MPTDPGGRIRRYFELETRVLLQRFQIIETLLPNATTRGAAHRAEEGRHIEALLREFLNRHLPKDIRAISGFILRPSTKVGSEDNSRPKLFDDEHSRQLDVIIYDFSRFPVYEQFEEFAIVPPEGVIAIISVKKSLSARDIKAELQLLSHAVQLCQSDGMRAPFTALVGFQWNKNSTGRGTAPSTCFRSLETVYANKPFDQMITEICVISEFTVFKYREMDSDREGYAKYVNIDASNKPSISVQRIMNSILSVYYDQTRGQCCERPGFLSFEKGTFKHAETLGYVQIDNKYLI